VGNRLTKLVTRGGDDGSTGLADGTRTGKSSPRIHAIGEIDELNCWLGVVLAQGPPEEIREKLLHIQHRLFDIGGELSLPGHDAIDGDDIAGLEGWIQQYNEALPPLKEFILPGGGQAAAFTHVARAVCRRAERHLTALSGTEEGINPQSLVYLNRLSDLLFVLARVLTGRDSDGEVYWDRRRPGRT
jgi:cob(I)alamin adenosyltransferase